MSDEQKPTRTRFFDLPPDARPAEAVPYSEPRAMTAASDVLDLRARGNERRKPEAWQEAAWGYFDQIGEVKYAFGLIASIAARAMLYAALDEDSSEIPVDVNTFLKKVEHASEKKSEIAEACKLAEQAMRELLADGQTELLRRLALNLSIPGECYLVDASKIGNGNKKWTVASISELVSGDPYHLKRSRSAQGETGAVQGGKPIPAGTYVARIWRSHPRYWLDADSSMLGVLDQAEKVVLFDQVMRVISRSRLSAGMQYIPTGLMPVDGRDLAQAISDMATKPVESEAAIETVVPLVLTGPPELGKLMQDGRIQIGRQIDEQLIQASESAIERLLSGLDIPKNIVSGFAETRFSNALAVDDSLYKAHIEPLVILICDALTNAYLRPLLKKQGVTDEILGRLVVWYNPSQIVTRPDRSQAANEGYDRHLLSGEAWRRARGYSDLDAPSDDEIIKRVALEKVQIPPEIAAVIIEMLNPQFFAKKRSENQATSGIPNDISQLLEGGTPPAPPEPAGSNGKSLAGPSTSEGSFTETEGRREGASGGEITQGGPMPPRPR